MTLCRRTATYATERWVCYSIINDTCTMNPRKFPHDNPSQNTYHLLCTSRKSPPLFSFFPEWLIHPVSWIESNESIQWWKLQDRMTVRTNGQIFLFPSCRLSMLPANTIIIVIIIVVNEKAFVPDDDSSWMTIKSKTKVNNRGK